MDDLQKKLAEYSGAIIRSLRSSKGITQKELGEKIGVSNSAVANYEKGYRAPLQDTLFRLSDYFEVPIDYFFPREFEERNIIDIFNQLEPKRQDNVYHYALEQLDEQNNLNEESSIYLVGQTAAGTAISYGQLNAEQINTTVPKGADYALTVRGDSMEPVIEDGSIVFYKEQPNVENGQIAIIELDHNEVTCKKVYKENDHLVLRSLNDKYDDMIVSGDVRILGKVIL